MKRSQGVIQPMMVVARNPVPFSLCLKYEDEKSVATLIWSASGPILSPGASLSFACTGPDHTIEIWNIGQQAPEGRVLTYAGHRAEIQRVAWSPDGSMIASTSEDCSVQVWESRTGKVIMKYEGQSNGIRALSWSPDGRCLAFGSDDNIVRLLDLVHKDLFLTYHGHAEGTYGIDAVAWSPDGRRIASSGDDATVQVWDAVTGETLQTYRGHADNWALALAWSPDGHYLASAGDDVQVWDSRSGAHFHTYCGHPNDVHWVDAVAWSPDGQRIASIGTDHLLHLWDAMSGASIATYTHPAASGEFEGVRAHTLIWSPVSERQSCIACASYDGTITLYALSAA